MSYIGLFSYYNFDNWAYQPSYVSSNTPWFFNGVRVQLYPSEKLKIEPWFINGWQSYGRFNGRPGLGGQILWRPTGSISIISNNYGVGADTLNNPNRTRLHTDNSIQVKYYERPDRFISKMAFSLTGDAGCETGGGVSCMHLRTSQSAVLSAVIFNALIIIALIPLALRGVRYQAMGAAALLRRNLWIYGLGGIIVPFVGIKLIDLVITHIGMA